MSLKTAPEPPLQPKSLEGYSRGERAFDEALDGASALHPHYRRFFNAVEHLDASELKHRWESARRLLHEQAATYNSYDDAGNYAGEKPWQLDPIPLVISPQEWRLLETALIQRATLINKILADCYGAQELIRSRSLPPALVFAQPGYLRPCRGVRPVNDIFLHFYAADLARSPDGQWWIVSDRTQIPTGAGYALANRVVTSRVLPEAFRTCHVHRLAGFFRELRASLARLAPPHTDNPRIVVLTPGPYSETYFEQVYLARYLGYMLVEGQDLTVRDDRVYLKTLGGLEQVHVILRRVDDDFCDPLELRNDSILGVPSLIEALRAGNVTVANALGAGLLQSPALMAFLPGLCERLLDQELKLPSVATWWCGQEIARKHVIANLDRLMVRPAFRWEARSEQLKLSAAQREDLRRRIEFQPHLFAAQENIELSTAPSLGPDGLIPRPVALRVYLVASDGSFKAMPGGLTRVGGDNGWHSVSMQQGGASKDTWVLSDQPVEEVTLLHSSGGDVQLRRVGNNLPSRLADNFFWLGRYAERADATARLLRAALSRFTLESTGTSMPPLTPILQTLKIEVQPDSEPADMEARLLGAIFDFEHPGSLRATAECLQRLAIFLRERTSNDLWQVLSAMAEQLSMPATALGMLAGDATSVVNQALMRLAAFRGLARENMTRAQGWRFLDMGQRIERSIYLCVFLDHALASPYADNPSVLEAVLEVADSSITYRGRYNLLPNIATVYDLVLLDDTNPRSLLFQLNQLVKHFERLPGERENALPSPGQRILLECLTALRLVDPRQLNHADTPPLESEVGAVVRQIVSAMPRLSDAIAAAYFAHSAISQTGGETGP
ncbi:MAG TPA: circularly permuted type 2 ATP-grasp protein [Verrucomicrobiae bacterium]|nr:circularly permuted type 2 ATP-grasp protein [Verrucomicrobiae bacterium]